MGCRVPGAVWEEGLGSDQAGFGEGPRFVLGVVENRFGVPSVECS